MNDARRAIPHINHTPDLEAAACALTTATSAAGHAVNLCGNPLDVHQVRDALKTVADWFEDPSFFGEGEPVQTELAAVNNLILLATLLREHLRAGNTI